MPRYHTPQKTENFVKHHQVRVIDAAGGYLASVPVVVQSGESVHDVLERAAQTVENEMTQLEVLDFAEDAELRFSRIVAREI